MSFTKITIQATVLAERNKAWSHYTEPTHITQWNFASEDWCCPAASTNLVPGGKFSWRMEAKDGSFGFDFEGVFTEIVPFEKLKYALADQREVEISFSDLTEGTFVQLIFDAENENSLELQQFGWQSILNNFKSHTEKS
ncbi:MAG: activator of HSP90 ATPase [Bacteroidetes bacterium]|nr:activator of HSP90 ATPase [Bacteroidota bacterium]